MTQVKRRAVLMAIAGAFAQTVVAQQKKEQRAVEMDGVFVGAADTTYALVLEINHSAGVKALKITINGETVTMTPEELLEAVKPHRPKNGECPVCGTMAPPFKPTPSPNCGDVLIQHGDVVIDACSPEYLPKMNIERCKNCSAAFWQDRGLNL